MAPSLSKMAMAASVGLSFIPAAFAQWQNTHMCTEGGCDDCPWETTDSESGYPMCRIYETSEFTQDFPSADTGGLEVFFDIQQPDEGCAMIIRSPAGTSEPGCGQNVITAHNAACAFATLSNTFMLQWCCGDGDCSDAGASKRDLEELGLENGGTVHIDRRGGVSGGSVMLSRNGTALTPIEEGFPPEHPSRRAAESRKQRKSKRTGGSTIPQLTKRDCEFNQEGASYTVPGNTRVIEGPYTGPVTPSISSSQTVGWSSTVSAGINIEIFSAGVDFTTSESETSTVSVDFDVPDGQTGNIVWTPIMRCAKGQLSGCDDEDNGEAEFCTPDTNDSGSLRGSWAFQQRF